MRHIDWEQYDNELIRQYNEGKSLQQLSHIFNINHKTLSRRLQLLGIKLRNRSEYTTLAWSGNRKQRDKSTYKTGKDNHLWKGGRLKMRDGYILTYTGKDRGTCSHNLYLPEHIKVWEDFNNKKVPEGWIVHHVNGIRDDNRIENLIAMPKEQHESWTYVKVLQNKIRELEEIIKTNNIYNSV